jgi:acyl-CoA synthetase (AMP-forming)/AMP-acid ligase II
MNMDISIIDKQDNHISSSDTVGEIVARGPMVMRGYWGLGEKNEEFFLPGGWFRTGDAGKLSSDGYLTISGRWKDMYISGGENVYPAEVEEVIYQMAEIDEVAVIGVPHEIWGETGRAFIVLKDGHELSEADLIAYCRTQLAGYKIPKSADFVNELPHSANGKILKHKIINTQ